MKPIITIPTSQDYTAWYDKDCYIDKTGIIQQIKSSLGTGSALFFARPRRRGKSLFLSTLKHFFDEELFKKEYFEKRDIRKDEDLRKKAGTYFTMSLDLKPLYNRDEKKLEFDKIWVQIFKQIPDDIYKKILKKEKPFFDDVFLQDAEMFKKSNTPLGSFLKSFIETYAKEKNILLLIDEYDKPINDCLKEQKNEMFCSEMLSDLKDKLYKYLKDIPCITIITGINKLSMASFFSDFNNLTDYSFIINVGFQEPEVKAVFERLGVPYDPLVKKWYNGYHFSDGIEEFNPWAVNKYLEKQKFESYWSKTGTSPQYFRYLMSDILKVHNLEGFLALLEENNYRDSIIQIEMINIKNVQMLLHYFYYAGMITYTVENKFAIPNNDVLLSYEHLLFGERETDYYIALRTLATDGFMNLKQDINDFEKFISYLLHEKYVSQDKLELGKIGEQVLVSDIALIMKTFIRIDIRREVNMLTGRSDIEFLDHYNERVLLEFKVMKKTKDGEKKEKEGREQIEKYRETGRYNRLYLILIDLKTGTVKGIEC